MRDLFNLKKVNRILELLVSGREIDKTIFLSFNINNFKFLMLCGLKKWIKNI